MASNQNRKGNKNRSTATASAVNRKRPAAPDHFSKSSKARNGNPSMKWTPVPIDDDILTQKDFEHLVSFEVLENYEIVKPKVKNDEDVIEPLPSRRTKSKETSNSIVSAKRRKKQDVAVTDDPEIVYSPGCSVPWVVKSILQEEPLVERNCSLDQEYDEERVVSQVASGKKKKCATKPQKQAKPNSQSKVGSRPFSLSSELENLDEMHAWTEMGVPLLILKALKDKNFDTPTTIQSLTLPAAIMGKKDIVGAAETGSGKTLAFAIPILNGILEMKIEKNDDPYVKALILTPTRELAIQIKDHINAVATYTDIKTIVIMGGLAAQKQERLLSKSPDIIIATPGRLWELLHEGNDYLSTLSRIRFLTIDETDRMVERGHFQELEGILGMVNSDPDSVALRQNFIFSATLSFTHEPPQRLKHGGKSNGKVQIKKVSSKEKLRSIMELVGIKENPKIVDITSKKGTCEKLTEMQISCQLSDKDYYLYYFVVRHPGRTIVFCNSINCVRRLTNLFFLLKCEPLPLHSEMHQKQRLRSLEAFTANDRGILIATDVAARGLDIVDIQHVIHYQVPKTAESYIHRSGRTARAFKGGLSVTLIEPGELYLLRNIMKSLDRENDFLPAFEVNDEIFQEIKARVNMAVKVEKFEHTVRKKFADVNWMEKARKEMDLASSEDETDDDEHTQRTSKGIRKNMELAKKELERCKRELHEMLSTNIYARKRVGDVRNTLKKMAAVTKKAIGT